MVKGIAVTVCALATVLLVGRGAGAPWTAHAASQAAQAGAAQMPKGQMPMSMQDMMKMHQQMMADMTAEQARLDDLVKKMNAATGTAKVNAIADVVTQLAQQHRAMGDRMGMMHTHMMGMGGSTPPAK